MKRLILPALLAIVPALCAQTGDAWKKLDFLMGDWTASAGAKYTPMGPGRGEFSFTPELKQKIIVRRNHAEYDSGARHDDLMVIYLDAPNDAPRAIYFDTEGHVIRYKLAFPSPERVIFESDSTQPGPRYRLTYWMEGEQLSGQFEVAAPSGDYKAYLSWTSKRKPR